MTATAAGTAAFRQRFMPALHAGHFRAQLGLWFSSIGLGTYLGDSDAATDAAYEETVRAATTHGCNVIDTAVNYRFQRSERAIGRTLAHLFETGTLSRPEIIVATKGGFLAFDGQPPPNPRQWFHDTFVAPGVAQTADVVAGCHCMSPSYLRHQLQTSLRNLGLAAVDIYYIHNPETQLDEVSRATFMDRMRAAFAELEAAAASGLLGWYGVATWNGLRQPPTARDHLNLRALVGLAEDVGGQDHHFRFVQVPYNLAMPEAYLTPNQDVDGEMITCLTAAERLGMTVMTSASMLQGRLSRGLTPGMRTTLGLRTDAQRALQFTRSTHGVTTALVGTTSPNHVRDNLEVAKVPPAPAHIVDALLK